MTRLRTADERVTVVLTVDPKSDLKVYWDKVNHTEVWRVGHFVIETLTELDGLPTEKKERQQALRESAHQFRESVLAVATSFLSSARHRTGQYWLPQFVTRENTLSLSFFVDGVREKYSVAELIGSEPPVGLALDSLRKEEIEQDLALGEVDTPLSIRSILDARLYLSRNDSRASLAMAVIGLEIEMFRLIQRMLTDTHSGSATAIENFLRETSTRILSTVVLGFLGVGDDQFREDCRTCFHVRNGLLHGKTARVSKDQARLAIRTAEKMMELAREDIQAE